MLYRLLADAVLMLHLAFVLFVALGGLLVLRYPRLIWLHVPAVVWGVYVEFSGRICPLTPLENSLRQRGGETGYSGGFIDHYVTSLVYPDGLTRTTQVMVGLSVIAINLVIYAVLLRRLRRSQRARA
jgi:Protein of Unknown function (DUF2784)